MIEPPAPIAPGDIVSGLEPAELFEVQRLSPFGGKTLVEGDGVQTRRLIRRPLSAEDLGALVKVRGSGLSLRATQYPIPNLHPEMVYRQVQYLVEEADWRAR